MGGKMTSDACFLVCKKITGLRKCLRTLSGFTVRYFFIMIPLQFCDKC